MKKYIQKAWAGGGSTAARRAQLLRELRRPAGAKGRVWLRGRFVARRPRPFFA